MLVVKHLYNWSYGQTERLVADSITLRQFCRLYLQPVPDDTVLIKWANQLQPETLQRLLAHVVEMARQRRYRPVELRIHPLHPVEARAAMEYALLL